MNRSWKTRFRALIPTVGLLLLTTAFGASPAVAAPLNEAAGTVGSVVESTTGVPVPSVPSPPPVPVSPPPAPKQVPTDPPQAPAEVESTVPHAASSTPGGEAADADVPNDTPLAEESTDGAPESRATSAEGAGAATSPTPAPSPEGKHSVNLAEADPLRWFSAYVWPAVALEGDRELLTTLFVGLRAISPLPSFNAAAMAAETSADARDSDNSLPSEHLGAPPAPSGSPSFTHTLANGVKTLLYAATGALLALLVFVAWSELGAAIRSHSVTDRWHRGF